MNCACERRTLSFFLINTSWIPLLRCFKQFPQNWFLKFRQGRCYHVPSACIFFVGVMRLQPVLRPIKTLMVLVSTIWRRVSISCARVRGTVIYISLVFIDTGLSSAFFCSVLVAWRHRGSLAGSMGGFEYPSRYSAIFGSFRSSTLRQRK